MERRKFFRNFAVGGSLLLVAPAIFNSCSDDSSNDGNGNTVPPGGITIDLTDSAYAALNTVGGYAYKGDIIVIRSTETVYVALSKVCTHSQCTVTYNSSNNNLPCPCHGSLYTINGTVVNGPAPNPLKKYDVKKDGNILTIS